MPDVPAHSPSTDPPSGDAGAERELVRSVIRADPSPGVGQLLSPAARVLFLSAAGTAHEEAIKALLIRGVDWEKLYQLAGIERAAPVLWRSIVRAGNDAVAGHAVAPLRRLAAVADFRAQLYRQRLTEVLALLEGADIAPTLLKGAALAHAVYHSFADRPMFDLDLLVEESRATEAQALLLEHGWRRASYAAGLDAFYAGHHHLVPLVDAAGTGITVELHTGLLAPGHPFLLSAEELRRARRYVRGDGFGAHVPDAHHMLLHVCLHFTWSHMMRRGSWRAFRDVGAIVGTGVVDWPTFIALAQRSRGGTCCYWTFRLAADVAGVRVPDDVMAALRPRLPGPALDALRRHFALQLVEDTAVPSVRLGQRLWQLAVQPGRSGHGGARPWLATQLFPIEAEPADVQRGARKAAHHLGHLSDWARYWRAVIRGPSDDTATAP
jgi:hypothetical protein